MNPYYERSRNLREMGFDSYEAYMASNLWYRIRNSVLLAAKRACVGCGKHATEVHHKNYALATLRGETLTMLAPVCRQCHTKIEFDGTAKRTLEEANRLLSRMTLSQASPATPPPVQPGFCPCGRRVRHSRRRTHRMCHGCSKKPQWERLALWKEIHFIRQKRNERINHIAQRRAAEMVTAESRVDECDWV